MIITILRALVLSADGKPEIYCSTRFYTDISSFETLKSWCFGVLRVGKLPTKKLCMIKNF